MCITDVPEQRNGRETQKTLSSQVMKTGLSSEGQGMDAPGSKGLEAEDTPEIVRTHGHQGPSV